MKYSYWHSTEQYQAVDGAFLENVHRTVSQRTRIFDGKQLQKNAQRRRKHCALAVVRRSQKWTFRSQDHSLPGAKVPGVELSLPGTFAPWNFRSLELSLPPTNVGLAKQLMELSLHGTFTPRCAYLCVFIFTVPFPGTFVPWNFRSPLPDRLLKE